MTTAAAKTGKQEAFFLEESIDGTGYGIRREWISLALYGLSVPCSVRKGIPVTIRTLFFVFPLSLSHLSAVIMICEHASGMSCILYKCRGHLPTALHACEMPQKRRPHPTAFLPRDALMGDIIFVDTLLYKT
jgi:hypothetical protein